MIRFDRWYDIVVIVRDMSGHAFLLSRENIEYLKSKGIMVGFVDQMDDIGHTWRDLSNFAASSKPGIMYALKFDNPQQELMVKLKYL